MFWAFAPIVSISVSSGHEVPLSPYYPESNKQWWLYQFEGEGYQKEYTTSDGVKHGDFINTNCGPACSAMVINYIKGKDLKTEFSSFTSAEVPDVKCRARGNYCYTYLKDQGHPEEIYKRGYYDSDWSYPGAEEYQIQNTLSLESIKNDVIKGENYADVESYLRDLKNAIDRGSLCICCVNPKEYIQEFGTTTKTTSHWIVVYGYDDNYIYLNDPGWRKGEGAKVTISNFTNALWNVQPTAWREIIIVDIVGQGAPEEKIKNAIVDAYDRNGGFEAIGCAKTLVLEGGTSFTTESGYYQVFEKGVIEYVNSLDYAFLIPEPLYTHWSETLGASYALQILGYPTSDISEQYTTSTRTLYKYQRFEGGELILNLDNGRVVEIHGAIFNEWKSRGYGKSSLGLPISDEKEAAQSPSPFNTTGRYSVFEGGVIHWLREKDETWVIGFNQPGAKAIADRYHEEGGSGSWLGFPVRHHDYIYNGEIRVDFEVGYICWNESEGAVVKQYNDGDGDDIAPLVYQGSLIGGEVLTSGEIYKIKSRVFDNQVGEVLLDFHLTLDNWFSWEKLTSVSVPIQSSVQSSYDWTVPNINTNQAAIRVIAYDEAGNAGYDLSDSFTITSTCTTPPAPTLYNPSISGNNFTISWSDVPEADSYILEEDTDPNFTSPSEQKDLIQTSDYLLDRSKDTYYYRVCSVNSCGKGPWSNTESVTISGRQWPGEITDRSPSDGETNQPLTVTLSWNCTHPTGESMVYDVWLSIGDEYFLPSELVSAGQTGTSYTVSDLPYNTTCYWKVDIRDETGDKKITEAYQFTTIGDSNPPIGSVTINDNAATTETLSVTLFLSAIDTESGIADMRASNNGSNWSSWKAYRSKWPAWNLADSRYGGTYASKATYTVYVQFRDYQGNISSTYSDTIEKISGTPGDIILKGESYPTIQDAIDAAEYGDTVYLTEGTFTYKGSQKPPRYPQTDVGIVMKPGVSLIGAGADKTKLVAEWSLHALVDADDSLIQGLTIINAATVSATRQSVFMESSNSKLRHCIITTSAPNNNGIWIYNGTNNEISNNLIINNNSGIKAGIATNLKIYNNTIVDNGFMGIRNTSSLSNTSIIKNNIVTGNYYGVRVFDAVYTHNNVWGNTYKNYYHEEPDQTGISGNISADPLFVNPPSDYSLTLGSPCINAGTGVGILYSEGAPDMGAFEYGGKGTVEVITNQSEAAFEIIGPSGNYQGSGTNWSMLNLPIGIYSITFTPIENLYQPPYEAKILKSNQTITFDGTYLKDTFSPQGKTECFLGPVFINHGEYATADKLVDIALSFSDEVAGLLGLNAQMMFSNDGVSWSLPETYSTLRKDWNLTQFGGDLDHGVKTVYVKISDAFGNWTTPFTDTILYVPNRQILEIPEEYNTIQDAFNMAQAGDIVHVMPGSYNWGNITIPEGICLQGSGPELATLKASTISMSSDTMIEGFTIRKWSSVVCYGDISGAIISNNVFNGCGYAIEIGSGSKVIVRNNIIDNSFYRGIFLLESKTSAIIENNTIVNSSKHAIELSNAQPDTEIYVYNNIFANNQGFAIIDGNTQDTEHKHIFSLYNTFYNNAQGDFGGKNSDKITGAGDINGDPMFVDTAGSDYRLLSGSPCINSGYPEDRYNDQNGTRNNRGAYGGSCLNTPPQADFLINPTIVGINTVFSVDASISLDKETESENLLVRWDFDGDDIYNTNFTTIKTETYQYETLGVHTIGLQIEDEKGFLSSTTEQVTVGNSSPNTPDDSAPSDGSANQRIDVNLSWQGGDFDSGDTVTYDVYFGTSSNPPLVSSGQSETSYDPGTLNYHTFYYWKIVATDNHGASSIGPVWSFITEVEPVPSAPSNLLADRTSSSQIDLTWTDNSDNEIGFKIERMIGGDGSWGQIYVESSDTTSYKDTDQSPDRSPETIYYYRVRSYNASGNSAYSNEATTLIDTDGDGLPDDLENTTCTNPSNSDTDNDGIIDGVEDANHNGLVDSNETDPCNSDTDGDGMSDGWEVTYGLNPIVDDASGDVDNDGYSNLQEYLSGTEPSDSNSKPNPPIANAGPDQEVDEGETVTLDGSNSSDPDDGIASYLWEQMAGATVTLSDTAAIRPSFTAPDVESDGEALTFQLIITDNGGLQSTDSCIVNITWGNMPPTANAGDDQEINEGVTVTLDGSNSSDPDDGIAFYQWEQTIGIPVTLSNPTVSKPTFISPPVDLSGTTLTFRLTVEDNGGLQASDEVSVRVNDNGITGFPENVITFISSTGEHIGVIEESGGSCTSLNPIDPSTIAATTNRPENFIYGLFDTQIKTNFPGGTVQFTFYLPNPAPEGYKWFKYGPNKGWYDYSDYAVFNDARDQITLTLIDGGIGDDDGVVNGFISDPSGLGTVQTTGGSDETTEYNCFITIAESGLLIDP